MQPKEEIEEWRPVPGFEDIYQVSSIGRVKNIKRNCYKTPCKNMGISLYRGGGTKDNWEGRHWSVGRLVATVFLNPTPDQIIAPINGNPYDPRLSNLELINRADVVTREEAAVILGHTNGAKASTTMLNFIHRGYIPEGRHFFHDKAAAKFYWKKDIERLRRQFLLRDMLRAVKRHAYRLGIRERMAEERVRMDEKRRARQMGYEYREQRSAERAIARMEKVTKTKNIVIRTRSSQIQDKLERLAYLNKLREECAIETARKAKAREDKTAAIFSKRRAKREAREEIKAKKLEKAQGREHRREKSLAQLRDAESARIRNENIAKAKRDRDAKVEQEISRMRLIKRLAAKRKQEELEEYLSESGGDPVREEIESLAPLDMVHFN